MYIQPTHNEFLPLSFAFIDFCINNETKIFTTVNPLTFILSPAAGGEGRVRGV